LANSGLYEAKIYNSVKPGVAGENKLRKERIMNAEQEKKKYMVRLYFDGHADFEVDAEDEIHALEKAEEDFNKSGFSKFVRIPDRHRIEKLEA